VSFGSYIIFNVLRKKYVCIPFDPYFILEGNTKLIEIGGVKLMHAGVIRDEERSRIKRERQLDFDMQKELEKEFKKSQSVSPVNTTAGAEGGGDNTKG
jgi:hypothetical protein